MSRERNPPTKTIGHARAGGETALTIHCLGCYHQAVKTFEELKLWNDMIFVDVPKPRHLVCSQCGSTNVKVMPIFPAARGTPGYRNIKLILALAATVLGTGCGNGKDKEQDLLDCDLDSRRSFASSPLKGWARTQAMGDFNEVCMKQRGYENLRGLP